MNKLIYKSKTYLRKSSPTILTVLSSLGVITTAVLAVKATPKAMVFLENERCIRWKKEVDTHGAVEAEPLSNLEVVKLTWRCYIPATLAGLSTIACIFGANALNKNSQASITSAYAMLNESYRRYRKAANDIYGEDADSKIFAEASKKVYVSSDGFSLYDPDTDDSDILLFYEPHSKRYFNATMASVINAQYHINRNLMLRGYCELNEFYTFLGLDTAEDGDTVGWEMDELIEDCGAMWLDFDNRRTKLDDGLECYIVSPIWEPSTLYVEGD